MHLIVSVTVPRLACVDAIASLIDIRLPRQAMVVHGALPLLDLSQVLTFGCKRDGFELQCPTT